MNSKTILPLISLLLISLPATAFSQSSSEITDVPFESKDELDELKTKQQEKMRTVVESLTSAARSNHGEIGHEDVIARYLGSSHDILSCVAKGIEDPQGKWSVTKEDQEAISATLKKSLAIFDAPERRDVLESERFDSSAWEEAIHKQVELEFEICNQLAKTIHPAEIEEFALANRYKLRTTILWFAIFSGYLKCDDETVKLALAKREELLLVTARCNSNVRIADFELMEKATKAVRDKLTFEQFLEFLVVRGEKKRSESNEAFIQGLSDKQKKTYSFASPAFRKELESRESR